MKTILSLFALLAATGLALAQVTVPGPITANGAGYKVVDGSEVGGTVANATNAVAAGTATNAPNGKNLNQAVFNPVSGGVVLFTNADGVVPALVISNTIPTTASELNFVAHGSSSIFKIKVGDVEWNTDVQFGGVTSVKQIWGGNNVFGSQGSGYMDLSHPDYMAIRETDSQLIFSNDLSILFRMSYGEDEFGTPLYGGDILMDTNAYIHANGFIGDISKATIGTNGPPVGTNDLVQILNSSLPGQVLSATTNGAAWSNAPAGGAASFTLTNSVITNAVVIGYSLQPVGTSNGLVAILAPTTNPPPVYLTTTGNGGGLTGLKSSSLDTSAFNPASVSNLVFDLDARYGVHASAPTTNMGVQIIATRSPSLVATSNPSLCFKSNSWCFSFWFTPYDGNNGYCYPIMKDDNFQVRYVYPDVYIKWGDFYLGVPGYPTTAGVRTFVIGWYDSSAQTLNMMFNNSLSNGATCTTPAADDTTDLQLGHWCKADLLSDVMLLSRVPTITEMNQLYNSGTPTGFAGLPTSIKTDTNLVAYWELHTDYIDHTTNGNNLAASNVYLAGAGPVNAKSGDLVMDVQEHSGLGAACYAIDANSAMVCNKSGPYISSANNGAFLQIANLPAVSMSNMTVFVVAKATTTAAPNQYDFAELVSFGGIANSLGLVGGQTMAMTETEAWPTGIQTPYADSVIVYEGDSSGTILPFSGMRVDVNERTSFRREGMNNSYVSANTYTLAGINNKSAAGSYGALADYSRILIYNRALQASEVSFVKAGLARQMAKIPAPTPEYNLVFLGDSITVAYLGQGSYSGFTDQVMLGLNSKGINAGTVGRYSSQVLTDVPAAIAAYDPNCKQNIVVVFIGSNDLYGNAGQVGATYTNQMSICSSLKSAGYKVLVVTMLPRGTDFQFEIDRQSYRTNTLANYSSFANAVVDAGGDYSIGLLGSQTNSVFYMFDRIHPNQTGSAVLANLVLNAIKSFY